MFGLSLGALAESYQSGVAPFSPSDVAGLQLWLAASALSATNNDLISTWVDASGNANDATSSGSNRPTYKTNILNNLPVLRFSGSNLMAFPSIPVTIPFTCFVVGNSSGVSGGPQIFIADHAILMGPQTQASANWGIYSQDDWVNSNYSVMNNYFQLCVYERNNTTDFTLETNGTSESFSSGTATIVLSTALIGTDEFNQSLHGDIAEILVYDSALSDPDKLDVRVYLMTKYKLPIIVDDATSGFSTTGSWGVSSGGRGNAFHYHFAGVSSDTATFAATLPAAGSYKIGVTYPASGSSTTIIHMHIKDDTTVLATVTVDQTVAPSGETVAGSDFTMFGPYSFTTTSASVEIYFAGDEDGFVIADAVLFEVV